MRSDKEVSEAEFSTLDEAIRCYERKGWMITRVEISSWSGGMKGDKIMEMARVISLADEGEEPTNAYVEAIRLHESCDELRIEDMQLYLKKEERRWKLKEMKVEKRMYKPVS